MSELDYRQAAKRVRRSVRTIKRWRKAGLEMGIATDGRRVVEEARLLEWWRERMAADPVHQLRLRRTQQELSVSSRVPSEDD